MASLFGEKLRSLRLQHHLNQVDLAHQLSLTSQGHVADLETHQEAPSLKLVLRIASIFCVSVDYLLRDTMPVAQPAPALSHHLATQNQLPHMFGASLRALREQRALSQTELVRQIGFKSRSYISNLEAGRKAPSLDLVIKIADFFSVTADQLLSDNKSLILDAYQ